MGFERNGLQRRGPLKRIALFFKYRPANSQTEFHNQKGSQGRNNEAKELKPGRSVIQYYGGGKDAAQTSPRENFCEMGFNVFSEVFHDSKYYLPAVARATLNAS